MENIEEWPLQLAPNKRSWQKNEKSAKWTVAIHNYYLYSIWEFQVVLLSLLSVLFAGYFFVFSRISDHAYAILFLVVVPNPHNCRCKAIASAMTTNELSFSTKKTRSWMFQRSMSTVYTHLPCSLSLSLSSHRRNYSSMSLNDIQIIMIWITDSNMMSGRSFTTLFC